MSVNWDISGIKDHKEVCFENRADCFGKTKDEDGKPIRLLSRATESLIWAGMMTQLNEVTEKNVDEWIFRLRALVAIEAWDVTPLYKGEKCSYDNVPWDEVEDTLRAHIGLWTNCSKTGRATFLNQQIKRIINENIINAMYNAKEKRAEQKELAREAKAEDALPEK